MFLSACLVFMPGHHLQNVETRHKEPLFKSALFFFSKREKINLEKINLSEYEHFSMQCFYTAEIWKRMFYKQKGKF